MLVKEGEEAPSGSGRQNTDRDPQAVRRATSYSTQLDVAMGSSGEGSRLQELVRPAGPCSAWSKHVAFRNARPACMGGHACQAWMKARNGRGNLEQGLSDIFRASEVHLAP